MKSNLVNDEPDSTIGIAPIGGRNMQRDESKDDTSQILVET